MQSERESERTICFCCDVSALRIYQAVRGGARTFDRMVRATGATSGCGSCYGDAGECFEAALYVDQAERAGQGLLPL